jgi:hypothetical protein
MHCSQPDAEQGQGDVHRACFCAQPVASEAPAGVERGDALALALNMPMSQALRNNLRERSDRPAS